MHYLSYQRIRQVVVFALHKFINVSSYVAKSFTKVQLNQIDYEAEMELDVASFILNSFSKWAKKRHTNAEHYKLLKFSIAYAQKECWLNKTLDISMYAGERDEYEAMLRENKIKWANLQIYENFRCKICYSCCGPCLCNAIAICSLCVCIALFILLFINMTREVHKHWTDTHNGHAGK